MPSKVKVTKKVKEGETSDHDESPVVTQDNSVDEIDSSDESVESVQDEWDSLELHDKAAYVLKELASFKLAIRNLEPKMKEVIKGCKAAGKGKKKKQSPEKKKNHGVMKKHDVPEEVTSFLGLDSSEQVSRRDLLTGVCNYVRENNLQNPDSKREFTIDSKMKTVLFKKKIKGQKDYEDITEDKMVYQQIMGAISYWFDPNVEHSSSEVSTA